jgi:hypothetical protein
MSAKDWMAHPGIMFGLSALAFLSMTGVVLADSGSTAEETRLVAASPTTDETTTTVEATTTVVTIPQDTTPPPLSLDGSLYDGIAVGVDHLLVSGLTEPGALVTIAGVESFADANGVWGRDIALQLGGNFIEVTAADEAGNASGFAFIINYVVNAPAPPPPSKKPPKAVVTTTSTVAPTTTRAASTTTRPGSSSTATTLAPTTTKAGSTTTGQPGQDEPPGRR